MGHKNFLCSASLMQMLNALKKLMIVRLSHIYWFKMDSYDDLYR
ncbi:hypothetical protein [Staphylococcus delphini]|nr:hypothetical protein [Staphylococcus delphini]